MTNAKPKWDIRQGCEECKFCVLPPRRTLRQCDNPNSRWYHHAVDGRLADGIRCDKGVAK